MEMYTFVDRVRTWTVAKSLNDITGVDSIDFTRVDGIADKAPAKVALRKHVLCTRKTMVLNVTIMEENEMQKYAQMIIDGFKVMMLSGMLMSILMLYCVSCIERRARVMYTCSMFLIKNTKNGNKSTTQPFLIGRVYVVTS